MSFGLACGSLVAGWYLGDLPQTDRAAVTQRAALRLSDAGRRDDAVVAVVLVAAPRGWRKRQPRARVAESQTA